MTQENVVGTEDTNEGDQFHTRAVGFRVAANDLQKMLNGLASGNSIPSGSEITVLGYFLSVTVLRALSAECMLKALAHDQVHSNANTTSWSYLKR